MCATTAGLPASPTTPLWRQPARDTLLSLLLLFHSPSPSIAASTTTSPSFSYVCTTRWGLDPPRNRLMNTSHGRVQGTGQDACAATPASVFLLLLQFLRLGNFSLSLSSCFARWGKFFFKLRYKVGGILIDCIANWKYIFFVLEGKKISPIFVWNIRIGISSLRKIFWSNVSRSS